MSNPIEAAAQRLREADEKKETCDPIRDLIGPDAAAAAYAVQEINTGLRVMNGARVIGHKIGLTNKTIQEKLGIDQPDFGVLYDDREVLNGGSISVREILQPKVEVEVAFVLGKDLDRRNMTSVDVLSAIDYALVSIEIVGSRIHNWDIRIADTIADNASASHWVIGHKPVKLDQLDLINCKMEMVNSGAVVSTGQGSNCLGSPVNATLWLANKLVEMGSPMRAGQLILTGALGPMVDAQAGDHFTASIEGLGSVSVRFTE